MLRLMLAGLVVAVMGSVVLADAKKAEKDKKAEKKPAISADMLVGSWETKSKEGTTVIEFAKDGKLNIKMTMGAKSVEIKGTYALKGDKLETTIAFMGKEKKETMTVDTLTATKLVTVDSMGKKDEFTKKK